MSEQHLLPETAPGQTDNTPIPPARRGYKKIGLLAILVVTTLLAACYADIQVAVAYEYDNNKTTEPVPMVEQMKNFVRNRAPVLARSMFKSSDPPPAPTSLKLVSTVSLSCGLSFDLTFICGDPHFETCKTMHQSAVEIKLAGRDWSSSAAARVTALVDAIISTYETTTIAVSDMISKCSDWFTQSYMRLYNQAASFIQGIDWFRLVGHIIMFYAMFKYSASVVRSSTFDVNADATAFNASSVPPLYKNSYPLTMKEIHAGLVGWAIIGDATHPRGPRLRPIYEIVLSLHKMLPADIDDVHFWDDWRIAPKIQFIYERIRSVKRRCRPVYTGHEHFGKRWNSVAAKQIMRNVYLSDLQCLKNFFKRVFFNVYDVDDPESRPGPDAKKLDRVLRKVQFMLHSDRLPRDMNEEEQYLAKMLWSIVQDAQDEWRNHDGEKLQAYAWLEFRSAEVADAAGVKV